MTSLRRASRSISRQLTADDIASAAPQQGYMSTTRDPRQLLLGSVLSLWTPAVGERDQANMKSGACRTLGSLIPTRVTPLVASNAILVSAPEPVITMSVMLWKP